MDISSEVDTTQQNAAERLRKQFDFGPYPRTPVEKSPKESTNELFIHNLVTSYYLAHRKVIDTAGKVILDAGCGSGYKSLVLAEANPGARIVGVDISSTSIDLARDRLAFHSLGDTTEFHVAAIEDLPSLGMQFDYVNCDEVLYFFDDTAKILEIFKSVLTPEGIIRSNLHSSYQRADYYRAQELFKFMGLMDDNPEEEEIGIVLETMGALQDWVNLKRTTWSPAYENMVEADRNEPILMNLLLQEDKGYRIPDLFRALEGAGLKFLSMVNWRYWEVADLFKNPDDLPAYIALGLATATMEDRLRMFELFSPIHRLIDFWCVQPDLVPPPSPGDMTPAEWQGAMIHLHPQLVTEKFREAALESVKKRHGLTLSKFISLSALSPVVIESNEAAILLPLLEGPQPFEMLVAHRQRLFPLDWLDGDEVSIETATQATFDLLAKLEAFLYVLVDVGR